MKKNLLLAVLLISSTAFAQTRVPVFVEKFNNGTTQRITPGASVAVADYQFFSNLDKGYVYSSTGVCDVRNVLNSTNYTYTLLDTARNPSAGENVFFNNIPGVSFTIKNIAIEAGVSELKIGHGVLKSSTLSNAAELKVEWQQQGADPAVWNNITMPLIIGGTGSNVWRFRESSVNIPAQPGLINIRFRQTSSSVQFRVDDIVMSFKAQCVAPVITVQDNASTTFCNGQSITLKTAYLSATQYIWKRDGVEVQSSAANTLVVTQAGNYTVVAKSSYCPVSGSPESAAKTITVNPTPTVQEITGADTYCTGAGGDLDVVATGGTTPFQFSWNNAAFATQSSFTVPTATAGNFTHTVIVKDVNNCQTTANKAVVVNQSPGQPSVTANGPLSFCAGGSVTLTSSFATGNQWFLNGEAIETGGTDQSYIADTDGSYQVMHTAANNCGSSLSTAKVVNAISFDAPTVLFNAGNDTVCTGVLVTLASSSNTNNVWKVAGNTVSTADTYTVPTTTAGTTTVTLFYTATEDAVSCPSGTATQDILINGRPTAPSIAFTGDATPCKGTTVSLSVTGAGGVYNWYKNANSTPVFTGTPYEFTATDLGAANYTVTETDANTCESAKSAAQVIDVKDNPVVSITPSGATTFCQGTSVTLTAASNVGVTFVWDNDAMSTTAGIAVANHGTQGATGTRTYTVTGTNTDMCVSTAAQAVTINGKPVAAIAATGGVDGTNQYEICANSVATLTGSATNATGTVTYKWNANGFDANDSFTAIVGTNTLVVMDNNCASDPKNILVNSNAVANPVVTGTNEICTGGTTKNSTVLTVTEGIATPVTYQWKLATADASGTSTAKDYTATEGGSYSVVVTKTYTYSGGDLACAVTSTPYTVTAFPAPVVTIAVPNNVIVVGGTVHFCQNQAPLLTAVVAAGTPAFNYIWNGVALSETFTTINGDNKVIVVDAKGCTSVEVNQAAVENATPVATITGRNEICASNANNTTDLTANSPTADSYNWMKNGAAAGGVDNQVMYTATTAGNYTVVVTQIHPSISCSSTSDVVAVSVKAIPTVTVSTPVSSFDDLACKQGTEIFIGLETTSTITAVPVSSTGATQFTYVWTGSNVSNGTTPVVTVAPTATENYTVTITEVVAGGLGCQSNVATQAIDVLDVNGQVAGFVAVCNGGEKNSSPEATGITTEVAAGQVRAYIQGAPSGACLGACDITGLPVPPVDSIPVLPTDSLPDPLGGGLPTDSIVDGLPPLPGPLDSLLTDPIGTIGGLLRTENGVTVQNTPSVTKIAAYPNPFTESIALQIALSAESVVNVTITDMLGRVMYSVQQLALAAGEHTLPIDATKLSNGMYICTVQTATDAKVINLVKKD